MQKRHSAEQIVCKLRQADLGLGNGLEVLEVCEQLGVSEQSYCRGHQKHGALAPELAKQLEALEKESAGLKGLWRCKRWTSRFSRRAGRVDL